MKLILEVNPLDPAEVESAIATLMPFVGADYSGPSVEPAVPAASVATLDLAANTVTLETEPPAPAAIADPSGAPADAPSVFNTPEAVTEVTPTPAGELDARGMPWDARIHSGAKTKTVQGNWKNLRGVDKTLLAQVEAELLGNAAPTPPAPSAAETTEAPAEPTVSTPPPAPASTISDFPSLIAAVTSKGVDPAALAAACAKHGVQGGIMGAQNSPQAIPLIAQELGL